MQLLIRLHFGRGLRYASEPAHGNADPPASGRRQAWPSWPRAELGDSRVLLDRNWRLVGLKGPEPLDRLGIELSSYLMSSAVSTLRHASI